MGPLSGQDLAELARARVDGPHPLEERDLRWLIEMSGGNPGIVEHLLEDPVWGDRSQRDAAGDDEFVGALDGLRDVVRRRVDRLVRRLDPRWSLPRYWARPVRSTCWWRSLPSTDRRSGRRGAAYRGRLPTTVVRG